MAPDFPHVHSLRMPEMSFKPDLIPCNRTPTFQLCDLVSQRNEITHVVLPGESDFDQV